MNSSRLTHVRRSSQTPLGLILSSNLPAQQQLHGVNLAAAEDAVAVVVDVDVEVRVHVVES